MNEQSVQEITKHSTRLLAEYLANGRTRTDLLKKIAEDVVELRSRCSLDDGRPDWAGRSPEYRRMIGEIYSRAGVPTELLDTVQAALRYHVGNLLRQRADVDDLEAVGLSAMSPKERLARQRAVVNALASAEGGSIQRDPARLLTFAEVLMGLVEKDALARLPYAAMLVSNMALESIAEQTAALAEVTELALTARA